MPSREKYERQILEFLGRHERVIPLRSGHPESKGSSSDKAAAWRLKRPESGTTSIVYFAFRGAVVEEKPQCCVRLFPKRSAWLRYQRSLKRLDEFRLPGPSLLALHGGLVTLLRGGPWILAESFLDGATMDRVPMNEETAAILGVSIGRLHANKAPFFEWGSQRYAPDKYRERCLAMARRRIEKIGLALDGARSGKGEAGGDDVAEELSQVGSWLSERIERWTLPDHFSFIHTELDGDDMIMLDESREVACIDIEKMRFNHRGLDLIMIERWLRRQEGEERAEMLMEKFFEAYWPLIGDQAKAAWQEEGPIFRMLWLLSRWASRVKAARRSSGDVERLEIESLRQEIRQVMGEG